MLVGQASNIKFQEYVATESRVAPCGQTDMKKVTVTFRNYVAKAPIDGEMKATERLSITLNPPYFTGILNEWLATRTCSSTYTVTDF
jgi:hypothetical protein